MRKQLALCLLCRRAALGANAIYGWALNIPRARATDEILAEYLRLVQRAKKHHIIAL